MIKLSLGDRGSVHASARVVLPLSAKLVAREMNQTRSFITHDLFHFRLAADRTDSAGEPRPGSAIRLEHRLWGVRVTRRGHMLWRDAERGFGFTDLSMTDPARGFPHACHYRLHAARGGTCAVTLTVRGTWTATWVPRLVVKLYLWGVMRCSAAAMRNHLLRVAHAHRRGQAISASR